jgi:hypothetical protein
MICYFTLIRNYSWWFQQWRVFLSFPLQELLCIVARGSLFKRIMFLLRKFCSASLTFLYRVVISSVLHWIVMVLVHSQDGSPTVNFLCSINGEFSEMLYIFIFPVHAFSFRITLLCSSWDIFLWLLCEVYKWPKIIWSIMMIYTMRYIYADWITIRRSTSIDTY